MATKASDLDTADHAKILTHGNSGAGKSELGATFYRPLILLCERQAVRTIRRRNPDAEIEFIESTDDLRGALSMLKMQHQRGDCPYDGVVLDSLTEMQQILKKDILDQAKRESLTMGEWGVVIDRTANITRSFRDLPMHVLVLCRSEESFSNDERFVRPSLQGKKLPNDIAGFFNIVGYQFKKQNPDGEIVHLTLFEGVDGFLTKGDADLERVEVPNVPLWLRKMYGAGTLGACSDEELKKLKAIGATETGHRHKPEEEVEAPDEKLNAEPGQEPAKKSESKKGKGNKQNSAAEEGAAAAAAAAAAAS